MRTQLILFGAAALASCKPNPPRDCVTAHRQALQCEGRSYPGGDRELLLACFPFSKPERITGAWVRGFELNLFFEGQRASAAQLQQSRSDTSLEAEIPVPNDGALRVLQVEIIGRRSQCAMASPRNIIVADRVISYSIKAITR